MLLIQQVELEELAVKKEIAVAQAELSVVEEEDCRSDVSEFEQFSVVDDFVRSLELPPLNVKAPEFKPQGTEENTPLCSSSTPHHRPPFISHSFMMFLLYHQLLHQPLFRITM